MEVAGYSVSAYVAQRFRLDGGAMFGSVPKVLWNKKIPADNENRIPLCARILVLQNAKRKVVVDLGCGSKWNAKQQAIYAFEPSSERPLHQCLSDVTDVIITHMHFDHAGGVSYLDSEDCLQLSYPNATHYIQHANWEIAQSPGPRERATYLRENIAPLEAAKVVYTNDGDEILPAIRVFRSDGHTPGLQWVKIGEEGSILVCPSELMPTAHHVSIPYVMGYDLCAETTMIDKVRLAEQALAENWLLVFGHDVDTAAGRIVRNERGRFEIGEHVELPTYLPSSG